MWYVYLLQCKDRTFYSGISKNVEERLGVHNRGKGAKYTKTRRPVVLLYCEQFDSKNQALSREIEIKNFSRENKIRLIKFGPGNRFPSAFEL